MVAASARAPLVRAEQRDDGVRILTFDSPPANAVDLDVVTDFGRVLEAAAADAACKAVVITGAGRIFCAGINTKIVPTYSSETTAEFLRQISRLIFALYRLPKPVVAAINGHAVGAGMVLALAADKRIAAAGEYKIGLTEVTAGIPYPAGPMIVVQSELSPPAMRRLALEGATYPPHAPEVGELVDRVVAPADLLPTAIEAAASLAAAPSYATVKAQVRGPAYERLAAVVERDDDPLAKGWF